jgi:hypothetical protein
MNINFPKNYVQGNLNYLFLAPIRTATILTVKYICTLHVLKAARNGMIFTVLGLKLMTTYTGL